MSQRKAQSVKRLQLREDVAYQQQNLQVDRQQNCVRNLLLSGLYSKNDREYMLEAYQQALPLYENARCNVDHPSPGEKEVPFARRFGIYRNVRLTPEGPRADLYFNPAHPLAPAFVWWAENCPEAVGLSHNADGEGQMRADGKTVVTKIHKIHSVDLVADPATAPRGLAESSYMSPFDPVSTPPGMPNPMQQAAGPGVSGAKMGQKPMQEEQAGGGEASWEAKLADAMKSLMMDETKSPEDKWAAIEQMFNAIHPKPEDPGIDQEPDQDDKEAVELENDPDGERLGADKEPEENLLVTKSQKPSMKGNATENDEENLDDTTMESIRRVAKKDPSVKKLLESYDRKVTREKLVKRRKQVIQQCKMASLPETAISDVFVESLLNATPKQTQKLIEDRRQLYKEATRVKPISAAPGPVGNSNYQSFVNGLKSVANQNSN